MSPTATWIPRTTYLALLCAVSLAVLPVAAQERGRSNWERADRGERGVTLHRDLDFTGASETFQMDVPDLRKTRFGDDHATSVSLSPGCTARLYRDTDYRGAFTEVTRDLRDLRGSKVGDDQATSLQVRCRGDAWGEGGVTLHRDLDFTGVDETFTEDVPDLRKTRFGDDHASSVSLSPGCTARLYRDPSYGGAYSEIRDDVADLRTSRVGNDQVTSLQVRCRGERGNRGGRGRDDWGGSRRDDADWSNDRPGDRPDDRVRGVTLHRDLDYAGVSETFSRDVPDLRKTRIGDDHTTSVSLSRGCTARLYRNPNYSGEYTEVTRDIPDLRGSRVGNDEVTSLQVRCDSY